MFGDKPVGRAPVVFSVQPVSVQPQDFERLWALKILAGAGSGSEIYYSICTENIIPQYGTTIAVYYF